METTGGHKILDSQTRFVRAKAVPGFTTGNIFLGTRCSARTSESFDRPRLQSLGKLQLRAPKALITRDSPVATTS